LILIYFYFYFSMAKGLIMVNDQIRETLKNGGWPKAGSANGHDQKNEALIRAWPKARMGLYISWTNFTLQ
jgi:hypothetical protein